MTTIRPAAPADIPSIRDVLVTTWHATYDVIYGAEDVTAITDRWHSEENLSRQLAEAEAAPGSIAYLVAETGGRLVATAHAVAGEGGQVNLNRLYVLPEAQGSGLGARLMAAISAHFPRAELMRLEVEPKNAGARRFYARYGFAERAAGTCGGDAAANKWALVLEAPMPLVALRPAEDRDAQDLFGLMALCFADYPGCFVDPHDDMPDLVRPGHWRERRGRDGRVLGGEFLVMEDQAGRVGACVALDFPEQGIAELHRLYVRPDCRGRGIATSLVRRIEAMARTGGAGRLRLWSDTRFADAHRLYRRLGYAGGEITRPLGDISNSIEYGFEKPLD